MNVLAIGAHYDDIELGCGGTLIRHVEDGDIVHMVVVTESDYTNHDGTILRSKKDAEIEGHNAFKIIKAKSLTCLGYKTKHVTYSPELIEKINEIIDNNQIDIIYTHWSYDVHQDHSAIGRATINAGRHVKNIAMYRSNWYKTLEQFNANYYVDISGQIIKKLDAIRMHKIEYNRRGEDWINFTKHQNENMGLEIGTRYAEAFITVKWYR